MWRAGRFKTVPLQNRCYKTAASKPRRQNRRRKNFTPHKQAGLHRQRLLAAQPA